MTADVVHEIVDSMCAGDIAEVDYLWNTAPDGERIEAVAATIRGAVDIRIGRIGSDSTPVRLKFIGNQGIEAEYLAGRYGGSTQFGTSAFAIVGARIIRRLESPGYTAIELVGGPLDGRWYEVRPGQERLDYSVPTAVLDAGPYTESPVVFEIHRYAPQSLVDATFGRWSWEGRVS